MKYSLEHILKLTAEAAEARRLSPLTKGAYLRWIKRFCTYCLRRGISHPDEEVIYSFIAAIATKKRLSASTQNQAFNAILFLFRYVLKLKTPKIKIVPRALVRKNIPTSLSRSEVEAIFANLPAHLRLPFKLMYGCGLRISEVVNLEVRDIRREDSSIHIKLAKGKRDRFVRLPELLLQELLDHLKVRHAFFIGFVERIESKLDTTSFSRRWACEPIFTSGRASKNKESGSYTFSRLSTSYLQRIFKLSIKAVGINESVTPHVLRYSYATFAAQNNVNLRELQTVMGHSDPNTTAKYIDTFSSLRNVKSPLDSIEANSNQAINKSNSKGIIYWIKYILLKKLNKSPYE